MNLQDQLEALIDQHGLYSVTDALANICLEKADHINVTWQDLILASRWRRAGRVFTRGYDSLKRIQGLA